MNILQSHWSLPRPINPKLITRFSVLFLIAALFCTGALLLQDSTEASPQKHKSARARATAKRAEKPRRRPSVKSARTAAAIENEPVSEEGDDDPDARLRWFMFERTYPFSEIPEGARRRAWESVLDRTKGQGLSANAITAGWSSIGPTPTTSAFPDNGGPTSGRINAIAVSPADTQIVLIGSASGGIWRSTDGGSTFIPVSDDQVDLAVGAFAFAPSAANIVYAGMGDLDNGYFGTGVLKSTDAGATWTKINNATFPTKGNCTRIQVDPLDPNKVIVTQFNSFNPNGPGSFISGIYVSTDGGVNWTKTLACLPSDVVFHPTNSQIVYAGVRFLSTATPDPGLYRSTNGGTSWTRVFSSPYTPPTYQGQSATRDFRVAVTPANPNRVYIYFGTLTTNPDEVRLEMSDDSGDTWTNRGVICGSCGSSNTMIDPAQFGYNTYLAASPTDANTVYVGTRDVFRSTDAGVTFSDITNSFKPPWPNGGYDPFHQQFHSDQQSFFFQPASATTFYAGSDGGLWKTRNGGTSFTSMNSTLSLSQFVSIAVHPTDATKSYGGTQDNGTQRRTAGTGWTEFSSGDGGKLVIDAVDPSRIYTSYVQGQMSRFLFNGSVYDGLIARADTFGESLTSPRIGFYPPIVGNGTDSKLYTGTWRLFICSNCDDTNKNYQAGVTWTAPGGTFDQTNGITNGISDVLNALAVAKSNNNVIYSGSIGGRAMRSTNAGATWTDITTGLPVRSITSITVSSTDPTLVYLTVSSYGSGHVFRSTNSGTNWTDISNNLPNIPTSAFLIDPLSPTTLYAGTDIGLFRSTDNGASWAAFNTGLPPVPVLAFSAQPGGLIQIGTYGRGAYELAAATATPTPTPTPTPMSKKTGVFRPSTGELFLKNANSSGFADTLIIFGNPGDYPIAGDWNGDGIDSIGIYRNGVFYLRNTNTTGFADIVIPFGSPGDQPVAGDWNGDGVDTIGIYRNGTFYLRNSNTAGPPDLVFTLGDPGDVGIAGDWNGDGITTCGVFRPSNGIIYLRNSNSTGFADLSFVYGNAGDKPVAGDWNGDGIDTVGIYRNGLFYLTNSNTTGFADIVFVLGNSGDFPIAGNWNGSP